MIKFSYLRYLFLVVLLYLSCSLPTDPAKDYSRANLEILSRISGQLDTFGPFDSVKLTIVLTQPHLFNLLNVKIGLSELLVPVTSPVKMTDTLVIKQKVAGIDTLAVVVTGYLTNNSTRVDSTMVVITGIAPSITTHPATFTYVSLAGECTLSVASTGSDPLTYEWYHGTVKVDSVTTNQYIFRNISTLDTGYYTCKVINKWGSAVSTPAVLFLRSVIPTPTINLFWNKDTISDSLFEGDSLTLVYSNHYTNTLSKKPIVTIPGLILPRLNTTDSTVKVIAAARDSGVYFYSMLLTSDTLGDIAILKIIVKPRYVTLTTNADFGNILIKPGLLQYRWKDTVTLTAIPNAGYVLYQWDQNLGGNETEKKFAITKNMKVFARFWPANVSCTQILNAASLRDSVAAYSLVIYRPKKLCPVSGSHNNGKLKLNGKLVFVFQK
jgi:hypothetical protein